MNLQLSLAAFGLQPRFQPGKAVSTLTWSGLLLVLALLSTLSVHGATYYVATNGNDSLTGTASSYVSGTNGPWLTIGHAALGRLPGDTVIVTPGRYPERVTVTASGIFGSNITFKAVPPRSATMQGFFLNGSAYNHIEGFNISNTNQVTAYNPGTGGGIYVDGDYAEIVNNYIFSNVDWAVYVTAPTSPNRVGVYIATNTMYMCGNGIYANGGNNLIIESNEVNRLYYWLGGVKNSANHYNENYGDVVGTNILWRNNWHHGTLFNEISYLLLDSNSNPIACTNDTQCQTLSGDSGAWMDWNGYARDNAHWDAAASRRAACRPLGPRSSHRH